MENADRQRSALMSFINVWTAFNGWMAGVSEREIDADMIRGFAANAHLIEACTRAHRDLSAVPSFCFGFRGDVADAGTPSTATITGR